MSSSSEKEKILLLLQNAYAARGSNLHQSIRTAQQALELSRIAGEEQLIAQCYNQLSLFHMIKGDYQLSVDMANEAIRIYELLGDEKGVADAKYNIAGTYYKTDNYHLGLVYLIDCRHIYQKYEDYHNLSRTEKSLGTIYEYFGDITSAEQSYDQAIRAAKKAGDYNLKSNAYNPLSGIQLKKGNVDEALRIIVRSIDLKRQTGDVRGLAFALYGRAKVYTHTGKFAQAEKDFHSAMEIHEQFGEKLGMGMAYYKLGCLYMEMGKTEEARQTLLNGAEFSAIHNIVITRFKCYYQLYRLNKKEGNQACALSYLEQYLEEKERVINAQTLQVIESYALIKQMDEAKVEREKAELMAQKEKAEHHAKVRRDFISAVSHELHTPLNGVMSIARMLQSHTMPDEEMLSSLQRSSQRLHHIISNMLDYSNLDSGKVQVELKPFYLEEWLQQRIATYQSEVHEHGLTLETNISLFHSVYKADESKLGAVLDNLLSNAIKNTRNGSIKITAQSSAVNAWQDKVQLTIADSGSGMSAQQLEQLFTGFQLAEKVTTKQKEGAGLGLAIVKKLVELMDGHITVNSTPGQGSVFVVDLLLEHTSPPSATSKPQALYNKRCLLAEDNDINAYVLRRLLHSWGVIDELARHGEEAVQKANAQPYDFILMDLHMPVMDGFEAAKLIRTGNGCNHATPLFALTADITAPSRTEYVHYFDEYLFKPLDFEKLEEALNKIARSID